ncbi:MAG: LacI family DNA-binding transcriptional regulator [Victivallales bacterium]|nr:LacI family DNA-binding transcriptional regulator [Victivallales bacterium]
MVKSFRIRELLKSEILGDRLKHGEQLPPLRQLATQYGVSYLTVSRALEQLEQERLIIRVQGRGCFVNHGPGQSPSVRRRVLLIYHGRDAITPLFIDRLLQFFSSNHDDVTLLEMSVLDGLPSEASSRRLKEYLNLQADILMADGSYALPFKEIDKHRHNFGKIIFFNRYESDLELLNVSRLQYDYLEAGSLVARAFLENGRRRIVYLAPDSSVRHLFPPYGPEVTYHCQMRNGMAKVFETVPLARMKNLVVTPVNLERRVLHLLKEFRPDAFFAFHDFCAVKLMNILSSHGVKVGRQVDVVGCFDTDVGKKWVTPDLSTISFPPDIMLDGLTRILADKDGILQTFIPPQFVRRASMRKRKNSQT